MNACSSKIFFKNRALEPLTNLIAVFIKLDTAKMVSTNSNKKNTVHVLLPLVLLSQLILLISGLVLQLFLSTGKDGKDGQNGEKTIMLVCNLFENSLRLPKAFHFLQ